MNTYVHGTALLHGHIYILEERILNADFIRDPAAGMTMLCVSAVRSVRA
jgi:hypothetical protein